MTVLIFANGEVANGDWLLPYLKSGPAAIVAADGGARHLEVRGLRPDVVVGDMDSFPPDRRDGWEKEGTAFFDHPGEKDETDLELALLYATQHYRGEILVFGFLGGRLDQALANVFLLAHPSLVGHRIRLVEPGQEAWLLRSSDVIEGRPGDLVSLLPLAGSVRVAKTEGLRWPLHNEVLTIGPARGISNVLTAGRATIKIDSGLLLCVHHHADAQER
jgi:thiamine pyrophosphokinase